MALNYSKEIIHLALKFTFEAFWVSDVLREGLIRAMNHVLNWPEKQEKKTDQLTNTLEVLTLKFFHRIRPSHGPIWSSRRNVHVYLRMYVLNLFKASHRPSDHMIRNRPLIFLSEICLLDENSEEVHNQQSPDGLLHENSEEIYNLHHNLQSPDSLLDENSEEVHNVGLYASYRYS